ncbi:hypothetical protein DL89DRAFT_269381 [Linderina pennispora]|uniref:UBR-type domain-containing protein n=1 Tax=Linderina pennispora TaxID=61395 RepID=A0A1Y1W238_9FUNG|nr:uncharacterized protein DL89DRAFT_269381 [Linderina pennispora]ORX67591.1 hypothetical protein DL89DRAFT_269381 [Linderina pennispora]
MPDPPPEPAPHTSAPCDGQAADEAIVTAHSFLVHQADLEREAAEVLPGKFDECTYDKGYIRQPLFACLTCTHPPSKYQRSKADTGPETAPAGMCYSCSIECHTGHEVIELFAKRSFQCDCGTARLLPAGKGSCCELKSTRTMLAEFTNTKNAYNHNFWGFYCRCDKFYDPDDSTVMIQCYICNDWYHDRCIGKMPDEDDYEDYICRERIDTTLVFRGAIAWLPYTSAEEQKVDVVSTEDKAQENADERPRKRTKTSACRLLPDNNDICTCVVCIKKIEMQNLEFLLDSDEIVEPEVDDSRGESLIRRMDHTRAVDAASAYHAMSTKLKEYLRPFASTGKVVTQQDIAKFFEQQKQNTP